MVADLRRQVGPLVFNNSVTAHILNEYLIYVRLSEEEMWALKSNFVSTKSGYCSSLTDCLFVF